MSALLGSGVSVAFRRGRSSLSGAALSALLRGMSVYVDDSPSNTLVLFSADLASVPENLDDAPELVEVLPQVSRRLLAGV